MQNPNSTTELSREEVDALAEPAVIEFGAAHCGHCRAAQPLIAEALARSPGVRHFKVEDGPGRRLGRSFRVKLWPTLVFLSRGQEVARLVRPGDVQAIDDALRLIDITAAKGDS